MTIEWLAGNRIRGTSTERTSTTGFNPVTTVAGGWKEVGRTTLGSAGTTITVSSLADKRYYKLLLNTEDNTGSNIAAYRFNGDTGNNYANRYSTVGGSDSTEASLSYMYADIDGNADPCFSVGYIANLTAKEKLFIGHSNNQQTAGAGTAPRRSEMAGKWANTSASINSISAILSSGNNFAIGSELVVLGWDPADTHTTNFWEELASVELGVANNEINTGVFTAKKYLWVQVFVPSSTGGANNYDMRVGNTTIDTGSNYSFRYSIDGGADPASPPVNQTTYKTSFNSASGSEPAFTNVFIVNNSANEKLFIGHAVRYDTAGAGTAPHRYESVGKWTNGGVSAQINTIRFYHQTGASTFGAGTIIKVWGSN